MIRLERHSFKTPPVKDGDYFTIRNDGDLDSFSYTVAHGWNTSTYSYDYPIDADAMAEDNKWWLTLYGIGSENWIDALEQIREEAVEKRNGCNFDDEDDPMYDILSEMIGRIDSALECAEALR